MWHERKNTFNNENEVVIVSWFFSRIVAMKRYYDYIKCIIKLMDMKIKWRLLPNSLPERWFRKKAELYSEVFTSMTVNLNHHQWLFILVVFYYFLFFVVVFFLNTRIQ